MKNGGRLYQRVMQQEGYVRLLLPQKNLDFSASKVEPVEEI